MLRNKLQVTNLSIGIAIVILFVVTGQLMRHYYYNADAPDVERLYRRSRHLFLLLAGLGQGGIGVYIQPFQAKLANMIQWLATILMTTGSVCLSLAFFYEIPTQIIETPVSRFGLYLLLAGVSSHLVSFLLNRYKAGAR